MNTWFKLKWRSGDREFVTDYWLPEGYERPENWKKRRNYILRCIAFGKRHGTEYLGMERK